MQLDTEGGEHTVACFLHAGTSASASSTSTPARYDLDLELSKLGGGSSSSLSAATSSRSKEELGAHQMEAKKPMLFGQEVPVEAYEQW